MSDTTRVYQDRSEIWLIDLRNQFREQVVDAERESHACWSDNNPAEGERYDQRVTGLNDLIRNIDREFDARADERKTSREAAGEAFDPTGGALAFWLNKMDAQRQEMIVDRAEFGWDLAGRHYLAHYTPTTGFSVLVQVSAGTADSILVGKDSYLPANDSEQLESALRAERQTASS